MLNHSLIFEPNKVEVILEIIIKRDSKAWFIEIEHGKFQNKKIANRKNKTGPRFTCIFMVCL